MSRTKLFSICQILLLTTIIVISILDVYVNSSKFWLVSFSGLGWLKLVFYIVILIVGIMQIVFASMDKNGVAIAAGIVAILCWLPFVGISVITLNIIVIARRG